MYFSETFRATRIVVSPNGQFIAYIHRQCLIFKSVKSMEIIESCKLLRPCKYIRWSPDSSKVLLMPLSKTSDIGQFDVYTLGSPVFISADMGAAGLVDVEWAHDSNHILAWSQFDLELVVWTLLPSMHPVATISDPKGKHAFSISPDHTRMAVIQRLYSKDHITILDITGSGSSDPYSIQRRFRYTDGPSDAHGLEWADNETVLAWDKSTRFRMLSFRVPKSVEDIPSAVEYSPDTTGLGIRVVAACGGVVALGCYDETVRLLDIHSLDVLAEFLLQSEVPMQEDMALYVQEDTTAGCPRYIRRVSAHSAPAYDSNPHHDPTLQGVSRLRWSGEGRYLAATSANVPSLVYVFDIECCSTCAVLGHSSNVTDVAWAPSSSPPLLAISTAPSRQEYVQHGITGAVFCWSSAGAYAIQVPSDTYEADESGDVGALERVMRIRWSKGDVLFLSSLDAKRWRVTALMFEQED
eukprot:gnl/Dysnectes_brevis/5599_a8130_425.p1 GENE.gnl/Dysnectes_brevis/5599_a8130_425~~gnl/Dysnectes_brevis/5599_a8130_425.p1  ORF type:complete len:467 (+),score=64.28 gnl/Dysnectes_brevis/5599_a8130_425:1-1401(+)